MKDVLVVGAGPAGMMAAITAAENGARVTLLEKMQRVGRKMLITGKGRCNLTNAAPVPELIRQFKGNGAFLNSAFAAFDNEDAMRFFEQQGVPVKVERGGRVFPVSDKAADCVEAMLARLHELGVAVRTGEAVAAVLTREGRAAGVRTAAGEEIAADAVILAVGGASYPGTGSTGDGYEIARQLGHTVTRILPSLVPLETEEHWPRDVQGLSLRNVRVKLLVDGRERQEMFGEMMFTHFGVTGPIILSLSRTAAQALADGAFVELEIDLKPALTPEKLAARILRDFEKYQRKQVKNALVDLLPHRLIPVLIDAAYLDGEKFVHQVTQEERHLQHARREDRPREDPHAGGDREVREEEDREQRPDPDEVEQARRERRRREAPERVEDAHAERRRADEERVGQHHEQQPQRDGRALRHRGP